MDKTLNYNIEVKYLEEKGTGLCEIIKEWLRENNIDALVYDFILFNKATIIVDYSFEEKIDVGIIKGLMQQILKRFDIVFELEE